MTSLLLYRRSVRLVFAVAALIMRSGFAGAQELPSGCVLAGSDPALNGANLFGVAYGLDRFVAVGDGTILMSTNGVNWARQPLDSSISLRDIAFGGGQFVSVGGYGLVFRSPNGSDWTMTNAGVPGQMRSVAFGNGRFVATAYGEFFDPPITYGSRVLWSDDGITWTPTMGSHSFLNVYYGGGLFVVCGDNGGIFVSPDATNWTNVSAPTASDFRCGAYGNGNFIVAGIGDFGEGQLAHSTNGLTWTVYRRTNFLSMCHGGGLFVGWGVGVQLSSDGRTWSDAVTNSSTFAFRDITFGMNQFVGVGDGGAIYTSEDATNWTRQIPEIQICSFRAMSQGNGIMIALGSNGGIYSSEDSVHFTLLQKPAGLLLSLDFGGGLFAIVGGAGIWTSADGTNWTVLPQPPESDLLYSVRYENGVWVTVGKIVMASIDGSTWTTRVSNPGYLRGLLYGDDRFVTFGWDGVILTSADGMNWTNVTIDTSIDLERGLFQDGLFSLDGIVWGEKFALVSRDGIAWYTTKESGALLRMMPSVNTATLPRLVLAGEWGRSYTTQVSTDLAAWSDLIRVTNVNGVTTIPLTNHSARARFFRARKN